MVKTKKEQKKEGEVAVQTTAFSRFYNFINNIDYKKHWKILGFLVIFTIILNLSFFIMLWCAL